MTKLRRSCSMDFSNTNVASIVDVAKALCIACKQKGRRSLSLYQIKRPPSEEVDSAYGTPTRMTDCGPESGRHSRSASGHSATSLGATASSSAGGAATRSLSVNSVSSEGSAESHVVEQEDIIVLTHDVKSFKEALGKLRRIFHPERDKTMRVAAHERLGEVLRILRSILEKYPPIQSTELLMTAGMLIQQVKGYNYEDEKSDPSDFFDAIDQLALAFSSRVSEYLMGDLDSSSQPVPKTRSCDNLLTAEEVDHYNQDKQFASSALTPDEIDARLAKLADGVDLALRRAKVWSKYAKDVMTYIEKRCSLEAEHARNLVKIAQTMRPLLKEESFLPFQSIYCMALDQDFENSQTVLTTCSVLQGYKFMEPLTSRRTEHEKYRKQIKETWHRELKRMHEAVSNLRKAKSAYLLRQQDYEKAKESALRAENNESSEASKVDKKRRVEDDALQKAMEAETTYKSCIVEANERQLSLEKVKAEVLKQVRELIYQCDQTMKATTVCYFQLQHTISAPAPVQFQTLCESSRLYEPGTQYMEFVKRLPQPPGSGTNGTIPFAFEPYFTESSLEKSRKSNGSTESSEDVLGHSYLENRFSIDSKDKSRGQQPTKAWCSSVQVAAGSDSDSMSSCPSNKSQDTSPAASPRMNARKVINISSGDELETDHDNVELFGQTQRTCMSKAAETHTFRKLKTPSRCRECDCYVYFHGYECLECGLASHKKCLEALAIQCGRKRLPRKMNTFGVDLGAHSLDAGEDVPYIMSKCIHEIEEKGFYMKGIYRVSGVKSKVEKLCQSFENGAELVDLEGFHPNVIANVLKLYLRQLPEPLLTFRLYPEFIKIAKDFPSQKDMPKQAAESVVKELHKLVSRLPPVHLATLACLMHHLYRVSEHSEHNNMPPSNLGIVFGPTLLRTSEGSASLSSLVDTVHQTRVIELLITYAFDIFGGSPESSQKDEILFQRIQATSARYRPGSIDKQSLSRTVSGASQTSDFEEPPHIDSRCAEGVENEDFSLPGYITTEKSQSTEESRHSSDAMHSSEDLLYSGVLSDDDFPEILLPDDSVFKKSSPFAHGQTEDSRRKFSEDDLKPTQQCAKVVDTRASLSSSPAVSEASHSSSLLRSTDEDSMSGGDSFWKDSLHPVPPPRKTIPSNLQLSQSFLHSSLAEQKHGLSSLSESSGVSSAASTSPTGTGETCQSDSGAVFTSTAVVNLSGQRPSTASAAGSRTSTSSVTAELRRQFFESSSAAAAPSEASLVARGSSGSLADISKSSLKIAETLPGSVAASTSSVVPSQQAVLSAHQESCHQSQHACGEHKQEDSCCAALAQHVSKISQSHDVKTCSGQLRYISPLAPSAYRTRGSSLGFVPCLSEENYNMFEIFCLSTENVGFSTESFSSTNYRSSVATTKITSGNGRSVPFPVSSAAVAEDFSSDSKHIKVSSSMKHLSQNPSSNISVDLSRTDYHDGSSSADFRCYSELASSSSAVYTSQQDQSLGVVSDKLSMDRQPRFV